MKVQSLLILTMTYLLSGCSAFGIRSEFEQPPYVVAETLSDQIEVRRYSQRVAVETTLDISDYDESRNAAFRLLFEYISGNNWGDEAAAVVSPNEVSSASAQVSMTAPVETWRSRRGGMRMRFFLPREFTLDAAPKAKVPRVHLVKVVARLEAVLRFSGIATEDAVGKKTKDLLRALDQSSWRGVNEPVTYLYDPPWTILFFRRNEIAIPVVLASS